MVRDVQMEGDLVSTPIEVVLQSLHAGRVTGTLWLEGGGFTKRLFIDHGRLMASASSDPRDFLGTYLVDWGHVSAQQLDRLVELQDRHKVLVGELMVRSGAVEESVLDRVLQVVAREVALSAFLWKDGRYRVELCQLPESSLRPTAIPIDELVLEGLRRRRRWGEMRQVVASPRVRPRLLRPRALDLLSREAAEILGRADGELAMSELARLSREPMFVVWDTVSQAASQGIVELVPPGEGADDSGSGATFGSVRTMTAQVEQALARGELRPAMVTIRLLSRRFRGAADIDVVVDALRTRVDEAVGRILTGEHLVVEQGPGAAGLVSDELEERVVDLADGRSSLSQVVVATGGDQLEVRAAIADLVRRGVLEVREPARW